MKLVSGLLGVVAVVLAGCVHSLNPLYTQEDLAFEPQLLGVWAEKQDAKERWTFEKAGEKSYRVVYEEDGERGEFEVHLVRLGDRLYLDFFPDKSAMEDLQRNDFYKFHWLPAHTFARVYEVEPRLKMAFMDPDWLKKHLTEEPESIAHARLDQDEDALVLTASTRALQEFVQKHADVAFGEASDLLRFGAGGKSE